MLNSILGTFLCLVLSNSVILLFVVCVNPQLRVVSLVLLWDIFVFAILLDSSVCVCCGSLLCTNFVILGDSFVILHSGSTFCGFLVVMRVFFWAQMRFRMTLAAFPSISVLNCPDIESHFNYRFIVCVCVCVCVCRCDLGTMS